MRLLDQRQTERPGFHYHAVVEAFRFARPPARAVLHLNGAAVSRRAGIVESASSEPVHLDPSIAGRVQSGALIGSVEEVDDHVVIEEHEARGRPESLDGSANLRLGHAGEIALQRVHHRDRHDETRLPQGRQPGVDQQLRDPLVARG